MCRAADIAVAMVNSAIKKAELDDDNRYYMDFMKLHKLMYLGQCYMLARYGRKLFDEAVEAHYCGPYVEGIAFIQGNRGFGLIKKPFDEAGFLRPTMFRQAAIEWVLKTYGRESTEDLIDLTKGTFAYTEVLSSLSDDNKPQISCKDMKISLTMVKSAV